MSAELFRVTLVSLEWPSADHSGGVSRYAFRIARDLRNLVDLTVVTVEGGVALDGAKMVYVRRPQSRFDRYYTTPLALRKIVSSIDSDVIHAFGDDWALAGGPRKVRTFMGSSLSEARTSRGLRKLNHYVLALSEVISARRSNFRIAIGPDSMDEFNCAMLMPPIVAVTPATSPTKSATPSVAFVGSFNGRKRGYLVEQAVRAAALELDRDIDLFVVGPAEDKANWSPTTQHIAGADDQAVANAIANSWVLMAPSEYEGFGIPVFEGLSLGVPVIASRNPGTTYIYDSITAEGASVLQLVADPQLATVLADRFRGGPQVTGVEKAAAEAAVESLLKDASASRLLGAPYRVPKADSK